MILRCPVLGDTFGGLTGESVLNSGESVLNSPPHKLLVDMGSCGSPGTGGTTLGAGGASGGAGGAERRLLGRNATIDMATWKVLEDGAFERFRTAHHKSSSLMRLMLCLSAVHVLGVAPRAYQKS